MRTLGYGGVPAYPADATGLIRFTLPPGTHAISAGFKRTDARWSGEILSLIALLALAAF